MNKISLLVNRIWKIAAIVLWTVSLYGTQTTYYSYIFLAVLGIITVFYNSKSSEVNKKRIKCIVLGIIFSILILAGHYYLLFQYGMVLNILRIVCLALGGFVCFYELFAFGYLTLTKANLKQVEVDHKKVIIVFLASALVFFVIRLLYLVFCRYPGPVQYDTMIQLHEIYNHKYTNHHPIVMTWLIELGIKISTSLGGTISL